MLASFLATVKLMEKLDVRTVETLQGKGAGPKTVAALKQFGCCIRRKLPPPPPKAAWR